MSENIFYDCIIVGAGPGGSTAASFLALKGKRVLLLEKCKMPRDKTCGDGISGKSIGILKELGMLGELDAAPHGRTRGLTFSSPDGKIVEIRFGEGGREIARGYVCRRQVYDALLYKKAAKCGADCIEGATVTGVVREGGNGGKPGTRGDGSAGGVLGEAGSRRDGKAGAGGHVAPSHGKIIGVKARLSDGSEAEYLGKLIIGADGVSSLIAREIRGADVDPAHTCVAYRAYYSGVTGMNGTIEIHFVKSIMPGYFWVFPLENGLANVGVGMLMSDVKRLNINLQKEMLDIVAKNPLFSRRFGNAKMVSRISGWSLPFGSKKRRLCADSALLVGDAAGLVDPFSGEGVGNAMLSGKLAAEVVCEALAANDTSEAFLSRYPERLWGKIWNELMTSHNMQKMGAHEWLLNFVISKAATSKKAREAIAGTITSEHAKEDYKSPLFYLKLLLS